MNYFDVFVLVALIYAAWRGFKKGFIIELFTFLALFFGLYAGIHFSDWMSILLKENFGWDSEYLPLISFVIIFLAVGAMVYFGGKAIEKVIKVVQLSLVNKFLGIVFSMLKMILILGSIIMLTESYDEKNNVVPTEFKEDSLLYEPMHETLKFCIPAFEESTLFLKKALVNKDFIEETLEKVEENK